MILSDKNRTDIKLISYSLKVNDQDLRDKYLSWMNDESVTSSLASPALNGKDKGPEFIEESFSRFTQPDCIGFFIKHLDDDKYIGTAKLDSISLHTATAWDGIMIGDKSYQGKGLAPMVYRLLLAYAFSSLQLRRISSGCNSNNIAMIKTFKRIGYKEEGRLRDADFINNEYSDHLYFGILKNEFIARNKVNLITSKE
tara:strand:+ start:3373 stop:3966 length:594 start_codon:yes stop_codon:yes gene_type:complete